MVVGLKVKFKIVFFDRSVIRRNWKKINRGPMKKAGSLVRLIARRSIRRGKKGGKPGSPLRPPKSRASGAPFKLIFSIPQRGGTSVVVGMVGFAGKQPAAPEIQEHGARVRRTLIPKTKRGDRDKKGKFLKRRNQGRWVTTSGKHRFVAKRIAVTANYPKRAFMLPALRKAKPRLPKLWRNSVRKV